MTLPRVADFLDVVSRKVSLGKLIRLWAILDEPEEEETSDVLPDEVPSAKKRKDDNNDDGPAGSSSMSVGSRFVFANYVSYENIDKEQISMTFQSTLT